ncbi:unnamed protein product [Darwinula stevensoni]|uniref:HTH La-type RNA-binding domain-containing protein n=1 Tax=Darwinula stevensoni TaxID=69355 RepID=A0A7R8X2H2_9CRUS|nr:unnamed protein product [Darwinula stevensoni]CAG0883923.1 unnamed protein product [Darwinula stevensoni]
MTTDVDHTLQRAMSFMRGHKRKRKLNAEEGELFSEGENADPRREDAGKSEERRRIRKRKKQLFRQLRQQIEFYFSEPNLSKDKYMMELMHGNTTNWVALSELMKFNRIKSLTSDVKDIRKALSHSDNLEVSPDLTAVRRKSPVQPKEDSDDCTIYIVVQFVSFDLRIVGVDGLTTHRRNARIASGVRRPRRRQEWRLGCGAGKQSAGMGARLRRRPDCRAGASWPN